MAETVGSADHGGAVFHGPWHKLIGNMLNNRYVLGKGVLRELQSFADTLRDQVVESIDSNTPPPLAIKTIKKKLYNRSPWPTESWREFGFMRLAVYGKAVRTGKHGIRLEVTVPDEPHPMSPAWTYRQIATILERGAPGKNIPPRPVFTPVIDSVIRGDNDALQTLRENVLEAFGKSLTS